MLLALLVPPQESENTQQTPNDEAQAPDAEPPLDVHSEEVKQVPLSPLSALQTSLGKEITLNTLNTFAFLFSASFQSKASADERAEI